MHVENEKWFYNYSVVKSRTIANYHKTVANKSQLACRIIKNKTKNIDLSLKSNNNFHQPNIPLTVPHHTIIRLFGH